MVGKKRKIYDVIICGGGMTGAAMALCLANLKLNVALLETALPQPFSKKQRFDLRVSALSAQTVLLLKTLDVWEDILKTRCHPYQRLRVWENPKLGDVIFNADNIDEPQIGFIAENRIVKLALWKKIKTKEQINTYCSTTWKQLKCFGDKVSVDLQNGDQIVGDLLIGADGAQSGVRKEFQIPSSFYKYGQSCLVASVRAKEAEKDITWQRFSKTGPQAFLPLSKDYASIVWYHRTEQINNLVQLDERDLALKIMESFPNELGAVEVIQKGCFPLHKSHASNYIKPRLALIGDSAHTINPLAGQGANLGFQDVICLNNVINTALINGEDWSSTSVLKRYEIKRKIFNSIMLNAIDIIYHGFSNDVVPIRFIRNKIMSFANVPMINNLIMRYATGLGMELPVNFERQTY